LLSEGVMAGLFKISSAKLNIRSVLLLVEVFANLHYLIQVVLLPVNLNCFLVFTSLYIEIGRLLPVA
jgi:hypothetical protein